MIILYAVAAAVLVFAAVCLYLHIRYSYVNRGLRFMGWLISVFTGYSSVRGLRRFAGMANRFMPLLFRCKDRDMTMRRVVITGHDGNELPLVIYAPKEAQPGATGFLWIHGGGYAIGTPGGERSFLKPFVLETNTVAVVPDYRRSVTEPYPAAFHDCCNALLWMKHHAGELGINENQIFVGGASAGGGLTAAVTLYARDSKEVDVAFQMPIYPMINDRMDTASMKGNREFLWDEKRNRAAWQQYLGDLYGTEKVPAYAAPAREKNLCDLPPTYSFVGTLDPFYDETLQYIQTLQACGVSAKCDVYEGAFHGFDVIPSKISTEARSRLLSEYKYAATHYETGHGRDTRGRLTPSPDEKP